MDKASSTGIPGFDAMNDTLGFVKKLWGGMSVPGMTMPTASVDEINQKISDLKAVESWLGLNMSMLRSTIQALEVQSATISTIQSMGAAVGAAMKPGADGAASGQAGEMPNPFAFFQWKSDPVNAQPAPNAASAPSPGPAVAPSAAPSAAPASEPPAAASPAPASHGAEPPQQSASATPGDQPQPDFSAAIAAPTAWWNMLQGQFLQAVTKAMADTPGAAPSAPGETKKPPEAAAEKKSNGGGKTAPRRRKT